MADYNDYLDTIAVFPRHWIWDKKPVFHLQMDFEKSRKQGGDDCFINKTRCGLVLWKHVKGADKPEIDRDVAMLREHAEKFARPCRKCVRG